VIPIADLFEAHVSVANLGRSIAFYRDKLGLTVARVFPERKVAFFWIGEPGNAMLGVWEAGAMPMGLRVHLAFRVSLPDLHECVRQLQAASVVPRDFEGEPTDEPVVLAWMPALSVFFRDPDDNLLEYIAMLPGPQRPELGVLRWNEWESMAY
jgi:lactoylglutathione lyase